MKKLYLLMAGLMLGSMADARELTFYFGNEVIAPNSTITYNEVETVPAGGMKEVTIAPELYISSDIYTSKLSITATCTSGQEIRMCAGGNCEKGTTVTKSGVKVQPDEKLDLEFEYIETLAENEEVPTITTTIEAQDGDYADTHKSFTIVMNGNASVSLIENDNRFMPVEGGIAYNLDGQSTVELFNMAGVKVMSVKVNGNGLLSTESLASGIYLYSVDNRAGKMSGKIYIR